MQMARRRAVFGSGPRAGVRAAWASLRASVLAHPVSALRPVLAWARAVSALSPALASEEAASRARLIVAARSIAPVVTSRRQPLPLAGERNIKGVLGGSA
jgi:hypothetical protein